MKYFSLFVFSLFFSIPVFAVDCFFTVIKENCWKDYDVTVRIDDSLKQKELLTISIPKNKLWARKKISCEPNQKLMFIAKFSPQFWEKNKDRTYKAKNYVFLPGNIEEEGIAWEVKICFSEGFSGVPFPPEAEEACKCNTTNIPIIKLKNKSKSN